jgi:hypothetical protein
MTKTILTPGQIIDIVTINETQYFCVIDDNTNLNFKSYIAEIIYKDNEQIKDFEIERLTINSIIIVLHDPSNCLTDEHANFYESIKFTTAITENNFKFFI